jgi:hypothetical protein
MGDVDDTDPSNGRVIGSAPQQGMRRRPKESSSVI